MRVRVLGAGAGGGVPQWNCACRVCRAVRADAQAVRPRSQASAAISRDGQTWFLLHASPDVREQIESFAPLHPRRTRDSPIGGVLLANGDLDACLGLLSLRESQPLAIYATGAVTSGFRDANAMARTLERFPGQVTWRRLELGVAMPLLDGAGDPSGLEVTAFPVPGKVPLHLVDSREPSDEDNVLLRVRDVASGRVLVWAPSVAGPSGSLDSLLREADCLLFDGTFWSSDELAAEAAGTRRAEEMGHWPLGGRRGSLPFLAALPASRRILVHINNTNPILFDDSRERAAASASGIEVAHDGMEVIL
jgi:pyrroloquinoline quinone biosynthesis protein B